MLQSELEMEPEKSVSDISLLEGTIRNKCFCLLWLWGFGGLVLGFWGFGFGVPGNRSANFRAEEIAQQFLGDVLHMSDAEDEAGEARDDDDDSGSLSPSSLPPPPDLDDCIKFDQMGMMLDTSKNANHPSTSYLDHVVDAARTKV